MSESMRLENFSINTNAIFGINASLMVPEKVSEFGFSKVGVIIDEKIATLPIAGSLFETWNSKGLRPVKVYHSRTGIEPDYNYVDEVTEEFRSANLDLLIGIGGGSVLDLTKGVGILLRNTGKSIVYRGMNKVSKPGVPVVLIPTTAGTGSEVTKTASFIDNNSKTKLGINGKYVGCLMSFLDPSLITSCPPSVTISSGLDALVHATEAITAKTTNRISMFFGLEAMRLLFSSLPIAVSQPENLDARGDSLLGSYYAGIAMMNAGGGPASGVSYPVGVFYGVPHGIAGGVFLRGVFEQNIKKGYTGYSILFDGLNSSNFEKLNEIEKSIEFLTLFNNFYEKIGAPNTLREWGINNMSDVEKLVDITMSQRIENLELNPVPYGKNDLTLLLKGIL
jgi:alcohol dehydrogenase